MAETKQQQLADQIMRLSPPDRLRLAAGLLEARKPQLAYTIANRTVIELGAALALARIDQEKAAAKRRGPRG